MTKQPVIVLHGGAGEISDEAVAQKYEGIKVAAKLGYLALIGKAKSPAVDAVITAVSSMEDHPAFNAGYGSVLNEDGEVEMDAAVMDGNGLRYGAVGALANVKNPVQVAGKVMESQHCFLVGEGATRFAKSEGFHILPPGALVTPKAQAMLELTKRDQNTTTNEIGGSASGIRGTVGAVAIDSEGHLAAATSTGGMSNKLKGRVGDSPVIGSGNFADDLSGAISMTGIGECLLKSMAAKQVVDLLANQKPRPSASEAVRQALDLMTDRVGGDGGGIIITKDGDIGIEWNSFRMAWAFVRDGILHYGCNRGEHFQEKLEL